MQILEHIWKDLAWSSLGGLVFYVGHRVERSKSTSAKWDTPAKWRTFARAGVEFSFKLAGSLWFLNGLFSGAAHFVKPV